MNEDELPGVPLHMKLTCPKCGWDFALGLRQMAVEPGDGEDEGVTTCSKCLCNFRFNMDGTGTRELSVADILALPEATRQWVMKGAFLAWLAQQGGSVH